MTGTHVALLRGINVGTAKRVAMANLRTMVEELGYGDVRTLLNSGNVVFSATVAAARHAPSRNLGEQTARVDQSRHWRGGDDSKPGHHDEDPVAPVPTILSRLLR